MRPLYVESETAEQLVLLKSFSPIQKSQQSKCFGHNSENFFA